MATGKQMEIDGMPDAVKAGDYVAFNRTEDGVDRWTYLAHHADEKECMRLAWATGKVQLNTRIAQVTR